MKKKMCMNLGGYDVLVITPELYLQLLECPIYKYEGWGSDRRFTLTEDIIEMELIHIPETLEEIEIKDIALENNRLVRENEKLKAELAKLQPSDSKELVA